MTRLALVGGGTHGRGPARAACWPRLGRAGRPRRGRAGGGPARRAGRALPRHRRERGTRWPPRAWWWRSSPTRSAGVCAAAGRAGRSGRVLSIAAGVTLARLEAALAPGTPVVRAMPNTPALVGAGAAAIAGGHPRLGRRPGLGRGRCSARWALVVRVDEHLLDAVTGLSGSGPAYVFLVAEALIEAGVLAGLPRDVSRRAHGGHPAGIGPPAGRDRRRPGRAAGRRSPRRPAPPRPGCAVLEDRATRAAFIAAVAAATDRSRQLASG